MSLWLVRAGRHGEQEQTALDKDVITIGWKELSDLSRVREKDELKRIYRKAYPSASEMQKSIGIGQIWRFLHDIKKEDIVALPLKTQSAIAIGKVVGNYEYRIIAENVKHIRKVEWQKTLPRTAFDKDILYSMGALMTVCRIERNDAEKRVMNLLKTKEPPRPKGPQIEGEEIDIEEYAKDQITKYIDAIFKGHDLARLVDAILKAQGHVTRVSPPGPDGGVDILASPGPLGFEHPRICVQVKSSSTPVDVKTIRELRGVMSKVKAEQGLFVAWNGFNRNALREARDEFFVIRLWDSGDLIQAIFRYYDKFAEELKAELPLKRVWGLVSKEEQT